MNLFILIGFLLIFILIVLTVFIYIWVFEIENDEGDSTTLLGLENMSIQHYLTEDANNNHLLTFYEKLTTQNPYIEISYIYTYEPTTLSFGVTNKSGNTLQLSSNYQTKVTNNNGKTFVQERIYFKNVTSDYYKLTYTLDDNSNNNTNIEILRIELKN